MPSNSGKIHALNIPDRHSIDLNRNPSITFRCRLLDTTNGKDAHRTFTGTFFPRFANLFLDEVITTTVGGLRGTPTVRFVDTYPLDVYHKPDGSSFSITDFVAGNKITLGPSECNRDRVPRVLTVVEVDTKHLPKDKQAEFDRTAQQPPGDGFQTQRLRQLPEPVRRLLLTIRDVFIERCGGSATAGIKEIGRRFRIMDDSGDRFISKKEFEKSLKDVQCVLSQGEVDAVFVSMDATGDGLISYEEYMEVIRGPMNTRRKLLVMQAFEVLDSIKRDGVVTLDELMRKYNAKRHPQVLAGEITEKQALMAFVSIWDTHDRNGQVTFAEFCDYYNGVSASVDNDDMFELLIRNAWHMAGGGEDGRGGGWTANTSNLRVAVEHSDGRQEVITIINDLGLDTRNRAAVLEKLKEQGVEDIIKLDVGFGFQ